ncbi:MAG: hypothetical protein WBM22_03005 [Pseudomonas fluorescens]
MMRPNYKMITTLWAAAFVLSFVSPVISGIYNQPEIAIITLIVGVFLTLIMILDIRQDRVIKGLLIILFGVFFQTLYLKFIFIFTPKKIIPADYISYLDIYSQVLVFACSGAGGSLIAAHADRTSLDNEKSDKKNEVADTKLDLRKLTKTVDKLNKKFNLIIGIMAASTLITLILVLVSLAR